MVNEQEKQMSSGGRAVIAMVIDFSEINGLTVIATAPNGMNQVRANQEAAVIFAEVNNEAVQYFNKYADGKFDHKGLIAAKLEKIGAKVIAVEADQFL
jgi:hypothetical protein